MDGDLAALFYELLADGDDVFLARKAGDDFRARVLLRANADGNAFGAMVFHVLTRPIIASTTVARMTGQPANKESTKSSIYIPCQSRRPIEGMLPAGQAHTRGEIVYLVILDGNMTASTKRRMDAPVLLNRWISFGAT